MSDEATPRPTPTSDELREQLRVARLTTRLAQARAEQQLAESFANVGMNWGNPWTNFADPFAIGRGAQNWLPMGAGTPYARQDGRNRPFVWTDFDLDRIRDLARWLATKNDLAVGAVGRIRDYTVDTGYTYEAVPGKGLEKDATALVLVKQVQQVIEEFLALNVQGERMGDAHTWADRERQTIVRDVRDGEVFLRCFDQQDTSTLVRFVEPEQVRQPPSDPGPNCTFGIEHEPGDVEVVRAYYVSYDGVEYDRIPGDQVVHHKRNVDSCVKRGLSDFFAVGDALDGVAKLIRNMRECGAITAAIPWWEVFDSPGSSGIPTSVGNARDLNRPNVEDSVTGRNVDYQTFRPGTIPRIGKNKTITPGPTAGNTSNHIAIVQACLRSVGARWGMPEYMVSGDASNSNFASTLVSGSPFVKAVTCEQAEYGRYFLRVLWTAIRFAARWGRFGLGGRTFTYAELSRLVDISPTPPSVAIANKGEEASIDHQDIAAKVMSKQTRRDKVGLDHEQEEARIKEEAKADAPPTPAPAPAAPGGPPAPSPAVPTPAPPGSAGGDGNNSPADFFGEARLWLAEAMQLEREAREWVRLGEAA